MKFRLTPADVQQIEEGFARIGVHGARTTEELLQRSDIGARLGSSSVGTHGMSPLPAAKAAPANKESST